MAEISPKKRIWGWYAFDWASQPYHTLLVTFVFGPFFALVAKEHYLSIGQDSETAKASAQSLWSLGLTITGLIIGLGAPFFGALADTAGRRLPWIVGFSALYVIGASGIWFMLPDGSNLMWGLVMFGIGFIGAEYALIFINSQLPSLGNTEDVGQLSGSGFAIGYIGGLTALAIMLLLFTEQPNGKTLIGLDPALGLDAAQNEGTRFVGPFVAMWYAVFMVPYFLWVRDIGPPAQGRGVGDALRLLGRSVKALKRRVSLTSYLVSSMFYRDALNGLYTFGGSTRTSSLVGASYPLGSSASSAASPPPSSAGWGARRTSALGPSPWSLWQSGA